jgi:hypothetical protein
MRPTPAPAGRAAGAACRLALALAGCLLAAPAGAADLLSFSAGGARYEVPQAALASVGPAAEGGLSICLAADAERALADFTGAHLEETVTVAIGATVVTYLKVLKPYAGGCINWPIHPRLAAEYEAMLTGGAPPAPTADGAN